MKANEAPEKLYMPFEDEIDRDCLNTYAQKNTYHKEIEYTRTDAFIEKACSWLEEHMIGWNSDFVDNFRNYMEGE